MLRYHVVIARSHGLSSVAAVRRGAAFVLFSDLGPGILYRS